MASRRVGMAIKGGAVGVRLRVCARFGLTIAGLASVVGCALPSSQGRAPAEHAPPLQARVLRALPFDRRLPNPLPDDAAHGGAVSEALLSRSPNGADGALFAVVNADGSVVQLRRGRIDGLSPAGTIARLDSPEAASNGGAVTPAGVVFNWVPNPILYIADPNRNAVVALTLIDDGPLFRVETLRRFDAAALNRPVDLAPAVLESLNPDFASNTTLGGGADFYVANRGNGTIVRMSQEGTVLAVRSIRVAGLGIIGPDRLNGIAVAEDATRIWVSISGPAPPFNGLEGAVLELPAFGADRAADLTPGTERPTLAANGTPGADVALQMGLGPSFNGRSCADCHRLPVAGGMGPDGLATVLRIGKLDSHGYDPLLGRGGPIARMHSVTELGIACGVMPGIPPGANLISLRNAPALFGLGQVDAIPDAAIVAGAVAHANGIHGRPNLVVEADGSKVVGKFGWKAEVPQLEQFVADALRNEHGITSPLAPLGVTSDAASGSDCGANPVVPKDNGTLVDALTAFVRSLEPLPPRTRDVVGSDLFIKIGCADCHTPTLAAGDKVLPLYSDLLLHNMGPALNDGVVQGQAQGSDWRTTPLWGLSARMRFLHDGRARSIDAAILAHGGEAAPVRQAFRELDHDGRSLLLAFLSSL